MVSMHGIDLGFMKSEESQRGYEEWAAKNLPVKEERAAPARSDLYSGVAFVLPDLNVAYKEGGFRSPIDDTWISSRSQLREHNKRHGVIQSGDIRGPQIRENMKKHMKYDPSLIGKDFSWSTPGER